MEIGPSDDEEEWRDFSNNLSEFHANSQPLVGADLSIELAHKKDGRLIRNPSKVPSAARFPLPLMGFALIVFIGQLIQRHLQGYRWQSPPIAATRLG